MTTPAAPTGYPASWRPKGAPADVSPNIVEAVALAVDAFVSALSQDEYDQLVQRTRNGVR